MTSKEFDERLDAATQCFYRQVFEHAYKLGQEFPNEDDVKQVHDPCNAEDLDIFEQSLRQLFKDAVGEDEPAPTPSIFDDFRWRHAQNSLRVELREIVEGEK